MDGKYPLIVSYGLGVDSTAVLVGLHQHGIRPDAILFSDTGSEKEETYDYLVTINAWLRGVGFPEVTIVRKALNRTFKYNFYHTLEGNCISNRTLPSLAFRMKGCSVKWKGKVMDKWVNETYGRNTPVYRAIGYDCSAADNRRFAHAQGKKQGRAADIFVYPLQLWGWHRIECERQIAAAGLPVPPKSSCFYCPAMKAHEVDALPEDKLKRIVIMEANAWVNQAHQPVKGLWGKHRMTDYIRAQSLLPAAEIDRLWGKWSAQERVIQSHEIWSEAVIAHEVRAQHHGTENISLTAAD